MRIEEAEKKKLQSGHRQRVFEKAKERGFETFEEYELLEFMLFFAEARKDTKDYAKVLLNKFGSLKDVMDASRDDIKAAGFGDRFATVIESYREATRRYMQSVNSPQKCIDTIQKAKNYIHTLCLGKKRECVYCIYLDANKRILDTEKLAEGMEERVFIHLEELFRNVSIKRAKYIIIGHNHPSGYLHPSEDDLSLLEEINKGVMSLRAYIFDSIITSDSGAISLVEKGFIKDNCILTPKESIYEEFK